MAISDYVGLKQAVSNWMARSDLGGDAADFVTLAEARLNRELDPVELDATITGASGSRVIDVSALSVDTPKALFLARPGLNEYELMQRAPGTYPIGSVAGLPRFWSMDGNNIVFERELDSGHPFRLRYDQRFALSDAAPTNWLLTNHPDVYLAAVLVWGGLFIRDNPYAAQFQAVLNSGIVEVKNEISQRKRGMLTVDPALQRLESYSYAFDE